jgi:hypothetical protein
MGLCGFKPDMVRGNGIYLQGVLKATLERHPDPKQAIQIEIGELHLFMNAFKDMYGEPEYAKKRKAQMIYGIAVITLSFFEELIEISNRQNISIEEASKIIIPETARFLEEVENLHQSLKKNNRPKETMDKIVQWIDENDVQHQKIPVS